MQSHELSRVFSAFSLVVSTFVEVQNYQLKKENAQLKKDVVRQGEVLHYVVHMMDEAEVPISEFDKIALGMIIDA